MKFIKVEVFVPENNVEKIIKSLNENQILKYGNYDSVYSKSKVIGNFRPLEGANPSQGEIGKLESIDEIKLEFRIKSEDKVKCLKIIKENHEYEVPVINMIELI